MISEEPVKRYYYTTIHFSPVYEGTTLVKRKDGLFVKPETGEVYRKRLLYDFGWGQENGFEAMPQPSFEVLIKLVEQPMPPPQKARLRKYTELESEQFDLWRSNLYGAVAVIMQDYVQELIAFLNAKIDTTYFSNSSIRDNFKCFSFDSKRAMQDGKIPGGILARSYEEVLNDYPQWRKISARVVCQVYG